MAGLLISTLRLSPVGTTVSAGLPNITGRFGSTQFWQISYTPINGAFSGTQMERSSAYAGGGGNGEKSYDINFSASYSNSIYSDTATTVTPESLATLFYIKA